MNATRSRTRNLWLASALAALAGLLTLAYVGHGKGGTASANAGPTVPVLVATRDLAVGTSASQALADRSIVLRRLPAEAVGPAALADAATLRGEVVVQPIYAGDQMTAKRFGPSTAAGVRSVLTGAMRVLQVPGDANQLLAGTLQDGDHVDVVASVRRGASQTPTTGIVLRDILVLQAPSAAAASSSASTLSATVALTDAQAARLFYVLKNGDWSFALRPAAHARASAVPPLTASDVLQAGS